MSLAGLSLDTATSLTCVWCQCQLTVSCRWYSPCVPSGAAPTYITAMGEATDALLDRRQLRDESLGSRGIDAHFLGFTHFPSLFLSLIWPG